jgi:hypothetical protein
MIIHSILAGIAPSSHLDIFTRATNYKEAFLQRIQSSESPQCLLITVRLFPSRIIAAPCQSLVDRLKPCCMRLHLPMTCVLYHVWVVRASAKKER